MRRAELKGERVSSHVLKVKETLVQPVEQRRETAKMGVDELREMCSMGGAKLLLGCGLVKGVKEGSEWACRRGEGGVKGVRIEKS